MSLVVGVEGPVLAGKSSLIAELVPRLRAAGVTCAVCDCFVDAAEQLKLTLPSPQPSTPEEQLEAIRFFLELDERRRPTDTNPPDILLLDRTVWTLEAHTSALVATAVFPGEPPIIDDVTAARLTAGHPSRLIYLDVSPETQRERSSSRSALPAPLLDDEFNRLFRDYFVQTRAEHDALWLDADRPLAESAARAVAAILASRR